MQGCEFTVTGRMVGCPDSPAITHPPSTFSVSLDRHALPQTDEEEEENEPEDSRQNGWPWKSGLYFYSGYVPRVLL